MAALASEDANKTSDFEDLSMSSEDDIEYPRDDSHSRCAECDYPFVDLSKDETIKTDSYSQRNEICDLPDYLEDSKVNMVNTTEASCDKDLAFRELNSEAHRGIGDGVLSQLKESSTESQMQHEYYITVETDGSDYAVLTLNKSEPTTVTETIKTTNSWINVSGATKSPQPASKEVSGSFNRDHPFEMTEDQLCQGGKSDGISDYVECLTPLDSKTTASKPPMVVTTNETYWRPDTPQLYQSDSLMMQRGTTEVMQESFDLGLADADCLTSTPRQWSTSRQSESSSLMPASSACYTLSINSSATGLPLSSGTEETSSSSIKLPRVPNNSPEGDAATKFEHPLPPMAFAKFRGPIVQRKSANVNQVASASAKETHNEKERERRNRISNACLALRELVPGITEKTDKATLLEFSAKYIFNLKHHGTLSDEEFIQKCSTP